MFVCKGSSEHVCVNIFAIIDAHARIRSYMPAYVHT